MELFRTPTNIQTPTRRKKRDNAPYTGANGACSFRQDGFVNNVVVKVQTCSLRQSTSVPENPFFGNPNFTCDADRVRVAFNTFVTNDRMLSYPQYGRCITSNHNCTTFNALQTRRCMWLCCRLSFADRLSALQRERGLGGLWHQCTIAPILKRLVELRQCVRAVERFSSAELVQMRRHTCLMQRRIHCSVS